MGQAVAMRSRIAVGVALVVLIAAVGALGFALYDARQLAAGARAEALKDARAAAERAAADLAAATAEAQAAQQAADQAAEKTRERIRVVRVREREIIAQPPTLAGAAESMARAADFRRRLDALTEAQ